MKLEIIAVTYQQRGSALPVFIYSLVGQTSKEFKCSIYNDGPSIDGTKEFMESIITQYPDNFSYHESAERLNVHGHQNRAEGIRNSTCPILHLTNADNYQVPTFVENIINNFNNTDALTFNTLHSYFNYCLWDNSPFAIARTDMAGFAIRSDIAKAVPFDPGRPWNKDKDFAADGHWIERIRVAYPNLKLKHLNMCLGVHN